jgi:hypothetical protein
LELWPSIKAAKADERGTTTPRSRERERERERERGRPGMTVAAHAGAQMPGEHAAECGDEP